MKTLYDQMVQQGALALPYETCGFVTGTDAHYIKKIWPLKNEWKSTNRYYVSKKVVAETLQKIKTMDQMVLGIYHSHPTTAPTPSFYDLKNHPDDDVKMIILSYKSAPPTVKCYTVQAYTYDEHPFFIE